VAQATILLKVILCFAKYYFTALNIDNPVISVVRFIVNDIYSCNVFFLSRYRTYAINKALLSAIASSFNCMEKMTFKEYL
jgi:hypothetical protein